MNETKNVEVYDRVVFAGIDPINAFGPDGEVPVANGKNIILPFNLITTWVRANRGINAFLVDRHRQDNKKHFKPEGPWNEHAVEGTWSAQFFPGLIVQDYDPVLLKGTGLSDDGYSGFEAEGHDGLTLETLVTPTRGERVAMVSGGLCTDYCVKATDLDGIDLANRLKPDDRILDIYLVTDAVEAAEVNPGDGERALEELALAGVKFITTQQLLAGQVFEVRN